MEIYNAAYTHINYIKIGQIHLWTNNFKLNSFKIGNYE